METLDTPPTPVCPLTGKPGYVRRTRTVSQLLATYKAHFDLTLPPRLKSAYFQDPFTECECADSGLRWCVPPVAGGPDYYEFVSSSLDWYQQTKTWAKDHALIRLKKLKVKSVFEVGCGEDHLLKSARNAGFTVEGCESDAALYAAALADGLRVHRADVMPPSCPAHALVMLHVLERIVNPFEFTRDFVRRVRPRYLLIAVPCHETLMGIADDPLLWPPHHLTSWSHQALDNLAHQLGGTLREITYEPLDWPRFADVANRENGGRLPGLPSAAQPGRLKFAFRIGRLLGRPWALRAHTLFGVIEFDQ